MLFCGKLIFRMHKRNLVYAEVILVAPKSSNGCLSIPGYAEIMVVIAERAEKQNHYALN